MCCRTQDARHGDGQSQEAQREQHKGGPQCWRQISGRTRSWQNVICDMIKNVAERAGGAWVG